MPNEQDKSRKQNAAEAEVEAFQEDLGPFVVAAETTRMAMAFTDAKASDDPIVFANDAFLALTGYDRQEVLGKPFKFLLAPGADAEAMTQIKGAFEGSSDNDPVLCSRRKDGSMFWAALFVSPVRDKSGDVVQHFISFVDLTKHKQEEERLRFLLDELNHRTQNTLATVQAIALQTLRGVAHKEVVDTLGGRILALAKAHSLLGRENWEAVSLSDVVDRILQPFGLDDQRVARFSVEGDDVRLQPKAALTLAMVFHELATNASKYGALSNDEGRIAIDWQVDQSPQGDRMRLRWQESGGPTVTPPSRKGFGSRLIEGGLAQDLGGKVRLRYDPAGVSCEIVMPVPAEGGWMSHE
jgi:PAS domain S-box-containing protein